MVRFRDSTDTSTLFQFGTKAKFLDNGSLSPTFDVRIKRNKRLNAKDIIHKKGIGNFQFQMEAVLSGVNRYTNLATLSGLAENQTTIYLDTEGINDDYNGVYDFIGKFTHNVDAGFRFIKVKFSIIENVN